MPTAERRGSPGAGRCAFCAVAAGAAEASVVARRGGAVVFLDTRPLFPGHCLVVPERHVETMLELGDEDVARLFALARDVARAQVLGLDAEGAFVAVNIRVSQSVPHLHVHVVPRRRGDGLRGFFWPRGRYTDEAEREAVAERLRGSFAELAGAPPSTRQ